MVKIKEKLEKVAKSGEKLEKVGKSGVSEEKWRKVLESDGKWEKSGGRFFTVVVAVVFDSCRWLDFLQLSNFFFYGCR